MPHGSAMYASTRSRAYSFRAEMSGSFKQMDHLRRRADRLVGDTPRRLAILPLGRLGFDS